MNVKIISSVLVTTLVIMSVFGSITALADPPEGSVTWLEGDTAIYGATINADFTWANAKANPKHEGRWN